MINLPSRCRVCDFARSFRSNLRMKKAPEKCFYGAFLPFDFMENLFLVHQQLVIVLVASIRLLIGFWRFKFNSEDAAITAVFTRTGYFLALPNLGSKSISTSVIFLGLCSVEICEWLQSYSTIY